MLFFSVLLTSLCSYSLRSIIWNEILGVRASFRVVTVGHYRVFRWMNGAFVHWLLFSTFWDKKKNLFLKTENVNRIFYYTKLVLNIVTFFGKFCFSDVYLKNVKDLVMSFGFLVRRSKLTSNDFFCCVWEEEDQQGLKLLLNHLRRLLIKKQFFECWP